MKKRMMYIKRICCLSFCAVLMFTGCGKSEKTVEEAIELVDPVSVSTGSAVVERRNIYDYKIYSAICCPPVNECESTSDFRFKAYEKVPGESVQLGDVLLSGDTTDIDKQIESAKEGIEELKESHTQGLDQLKQNLSDAEKNFKDIQDELEELKKSEPAEGTDEYDAWKAGYDQLYSRSLYAELAKDRAQEKITENNGLYELDLDRANEKLNELYASRDKSGLVSDVEGTELALRLNDRGNYKTGYYRGEWIGKNTVITAVGDVDSKELRCDYISPGTITSAEDVYGLVDGKRIEVEYKPLPTDEYNRLMEQNGSVYGRFLIASGEELIDQGDYAVIVVLNASREDVLTIPNDAVTYSGSDAYVYVYDGSAYTQKQVRLGLSDGYFTEVLSGLEEGDQVKSEYKLSGGASEAKLAYGDISSKFEASGYVFYASATPVTNPVEYGTVYFDEICVSVNEQVEEGQVLAKVHVVSDSVEKGRTEREIRRLREKISYLRSQGAEENKYRIESATNELTKKQEYLDDLNTDAAVTEITAPSGGMVTSVTNREAGELLYNGEEILSLANGQSCFIMVEDSDGKLSYGNTVEVSYKDDTGATKTAEGTVETANPMCLSKNLKTGYALVQLPAEIVAEIEGSTRNSDGWWSVTRVTVTAQLRSMENVLLLPKSAVKQQGGAAYVTVKCEDGSVKEQAFVVGGSDLSNYWAVSGLEEGMSICW